MASNDDFTIDLLATLLTNFGLVMSEEDIDELATYLVDELDKRELGIFNFDELDGG